MALSSSNRPLVQTPRENEFCFVSGLPRSGSTLLSAILAQNPSFHGGMTSPVATLFKAIIGSVSAGSEISHLVTTAQRQRLLTGLFESYYADVPEMVTTVFDTNRSWTAHLDALVKLFPKTKVLCCVRNVAWVMDSLERQFRSNAFDNTGLFSNATERSTMVSRLETLAQPNRMVGFSLAALQEAIYSEHAHRLMIVDYDKLVSAPKQVMSQIYRFLDEAEFPHDFENVTYDAQNFDAQLGLEALHTVHKRVEPRPRPTVLPPEFFARFEAMNIWDAVRTKPEKSM